MSHWMEAGCGRGFLSTLNRDGDSCNIFVLTPIKRQRVARVSTQNITYAHRGSRSSPGSLCAVVRTSQVPNNKCSNLQLVDVRLG